MFRKLTLSLILTVSAILVGKQSIATDYVWDGTVNTYNLQSGDNLLIPSGTFTGSITSFPAGATITITDLAVFQPSTFPNTNGNSARGTMWNYGTFTFNTTFVSNTDFTFHNYGMVTLGNTTLRGSGQTWTNYYGGTINFTSDVLMNGDFGNNNHLINYENVTCTGTFQMNSGSAVTNYKDFDITGTLRVNGGALTNEGKLDVIGNILMNNGASVIRNYCGMSATNGINNTSGNFYNYSYLHAINSDISNSANIFNVVSNHSTPMIDGRNFTLSTGGNITGPCLMYFTGTTTHTGGSIGVAGFTTDTIKVNDITRTQPTQIFDVQSGGTRHPNVIYNAWGVPDPTRAWWWGCSIEILLQVPLAINWNYFYVNLSNNIPVLTWSAEYSQGTVFEVQRSYDGTNFSSIKDLPSEVGKSEYDFSDRSVNSSKPVVYYRIKGIELSGTEKYTQTRIVRFRNKQAVSIYTAPNPFKNNFLINYITSEKEMLTIRLFNVSGQQKLVKNVSVNSGNNIIDITEAAHLASGLYVIQVSSSNNIILSGKVIKE